MRSNEEDVARLSPRDVAKFATLVALTAIFVDAAVGHGLTWENDPYWSYWVTKTFLIATVFGLGTAWIGIGVGRGAAITAVHTLVLTIYYWTLSPIGLPSSPNWLDLEHTWLTGVPIHFGVIYLGYLLSLWLWRRRATVVGERAPADSARFALEALIAAVAIVVVAGLLTSLALGEFPGITWFVVRLLVTLTFVLGWWALAGRDRAAAVTGAITLAFVWATYSQFVGPLGLPDLPLRIFNGDPPGATVRWLDYRELWLISLPIYLIVALAVFILDSIRVTRGGALRPAVTATAALAVVLMTTGLTIGPQDRGQTASLSASGAARIETGEYFGNQFEMGSGSVSVAATDMGDRVSPLPPHDALEIRANVQAGGHTYTVEVDDPMVGDPLGRHTTWWGVGFDVDHHGKTGIGTYRLPNIQSEIAVFGVGTLSVDGSPVAAGVPVHVMTAQSGQLASNATLELDVGDEEAPLPNVPAGHLRVLWSSYRGGVSNGPELTRYIVGVVVLVMLLVGALALNRREPAVPPA